MNEIYIVSGTARESGGHGEGSTEHRTVILDAGFFTGKDGAETWIERNRSNPRYSWSHNSSSWEAVRVDRGNPYRDVD